MHVPDPHTLPCCSCSWNYTAPNSNDTQYFNGTCGTPGAKSGGPWCYVDPQSCKNAPLKDQSGQSYDNCATLNSTHTMDTGAGSLASSQLGPLPLLSWG